MYKNLGFLVKERYFKWKIRYLLCERTRSLMDRISGFGPLDGGSIPPGFVIIYVSHDFSQKHWRAILI